MAYKVLDILKDLPATNCKECGKPSCFAFATGVYLDGAPLAGCPRLPPDKLAEMQRKLSEGRGAGEGKKESSHVQALVFLKKKLKECDFAAMAAATGATLEPGPPPSLTLDFLGQGHIITDDDVIAPTGEPPSVWVKVFLMIYATRATGAKPQERWVSFRELPNTVSKAKTYERVVSRLAERFGNDLAGLEKAALALGGKAQEFGSAEGAWRFKALPNVDLIFLYWGGGEEFGARTALLLDGSILEYLDHESIVFLAEAFVQRMTGGKVAEVIP